MSIVIGLLLGLLGGGGSILTVPMLVYVLHVEPKNAIVTSFVVVGISSLMALIPHARRGSVCWKSGLLFGVTGMVGAFGGGRLAGHFSGDVLMTLFGGICLLTGILMMRNRKPEAIQSLASEPLKVCPFRVPYLRVLFDGFFVGALTGMVGVGGGFLIVPALTLLVGFPIKGAVGTSLLVIAMNAAAGLMGYSQHVSLDLELTGVVASGSIVGSGIGALLSAYVKPALLRRVFGLMVVLVAGYILSQSVTIQFINIIEQWFIHPYDLKWMLIVLILLLMLIRVGSWIHKADAVMPIPVDQVQER
jgi:uncharacterized membrane protein YfcA